MRTAFAYGYLTEWLKTEVRYGRLPAEVLLKIMEAEEEARLEYATA